MKQRASLLLLLNRHVTLLETDNFLLHTVHVQHHTHTKTYKKTNGDHCVDHRMRVDTVSWMLRVRNITWEQNNYDYNSKEFNSIADASTRHNICRFGFVGRIKILEKKWQLTLRWTWGWPSQCSRSRLVFDYYFSRTVTDSLFIFVKRTTWDACVT